MQISAIAVISVSIECVFRQLGAGAVTYIHQFSCARTSQSCQWVLFCNKKHIDNTRASMTSVFGEAVDGTILKEMSPM